MNVAFIAVGSNIEPEKNILQAVKLLSKRVQILKTSTVYFTEPLLNKPQPKYYNCVLKIETDIDPHELKFNVLRAIEKELGRKRTSDRYASRPIDIDLILYGDTHLSTKEMVLPDPEIKKRAFLAVPLYEIAPELRFPITNKSIKEIAGKFKKQRMVPLKVFTTTLQNLISSSGK